MAATTAYVAGMPHLGFAGLSEHWLLKECGDRHWAGIAGACGLEAPRFRDASGGTAYAAFTAIRLGGMALAAVREHDRFAIASTVRDASRAQFYSRHAVMAGGACIAGIEMLSTFVQRLEAGNNRSVTRASIVQQPRADAPDPALQDAMRSLVDASRAHRGGGQAHCMGLRADTGRPPARELRFTPCPNSDFNGAGFMYFASFQAIVDRAEWAWFRRRDLPQTAQRELHFHGNVDIGDDVIVHLLDACEEDGGLAHWCRLVRASDRRRIADVVTRKRPRESRHEA